MDLSLDELEDKIYESFLQLQDATKCIKCKDVGEDMYIYKSCGHSFCFGCQEGETCSDCGATDQQLLSSCPRSFEMFNIVRSLKYPECLEEYKAVLLQQLNKSPDVKSTPRATRSKRKGTETPSLVPPPKVPATSSAGDVLANDSFLENVDGVENQPLKVKSTPRGTRKKTMEIKTPKSAAPPKLPEKSSNDLVPTNSEENLDSVENQPPKGKSTPRGTRNKSKGPKTLKSAAPLKLPETSSDGSVPTWASSDEDLDSFEKQPPKGKITPRGTRNKSKGPKTPKSAAPPKFPETASKGLVSTRASSDEDLDSFENPPVKGKSTPRGARNKITKAAKSAATPSVPPKASSEDNLESIENQSKKRVSVSRQKRESAGTPSARRTPSKFLSATVIPERSSVRIACSLTSSQEKESLKSPQAQSKKTTSANRGKRESVMSPTVRKPLRKTSSVHLKRAAILSPNQRVNSSGEKQLHIAAKNASLAEVDRLLKEGCNPNVQDNAKWTPLHEAVLTGDLPVIKRLLDAGAVINACGFNNQTPLHLAVTGYTKPGSGSGRKTQVEEKVPGSIIVAQELIRNGADPLARDIFGNTPRKIAEEKWPSQPLLNLTKVTVPLKLPLTPEIILLGVDLSSDDLNALNDFADEFDLNIASSGLSDAYKANHFIVPDDEPYETFCWSIARAMATGAFIVRSAWMKRCVENKELVPIDDFMVQPKWLPGLKAAQENRLFLRPGLFSGCHLFIGGPKSDRFTYEGETINLTDVIAFVEWAEGIIIPKRMPDPHALDLSKTLPYHAPEGSVFKECNYMVIYLPGAWEPPIIYNMAHYKCLPFDWLMESIQLLTFAPIRLPTRP